MRLVGPPSRRPAAWILVRASRSTNAVATFIAVQSSSRSIIARKTCQMLESSSSRLASRAFQRNDNYFVWLAFRAASNSSPGRHCTSCAQFAAFHPRATPKRAIRPTPVKSQSSWNSSLG